MKNWHPPQTQHDQAEMLQGMTNLDLYFQGRDTVVPYVAPDKVEVEPSPVVTLEMKRYFAAGGFTTLCVVVIAAAEQGAFAAAATVGGYIAFGGVGIGVAWIALKSCFTWKPIDPQPAKPSGPVGQSVNITINVAGNSVTTNTKINHGNHNHGQNA